MVFRLSLIQQHLNIYINNRILQMKSEKEDNSIMEQNVEDRERTSINQNMDDFEADYQ